MFLVPSWASASPRRHLEVLDSWLAVEPGLHTAVDTPLVAKGKIATVSAGLEDTSSGSDIEADMESIGFVLESTGPDPEDTGFQSSIPGASAAEAVRPGSLFVGLENRPEVLFDCCIRGRAAGYCLALPFHPWAHQPLHFSLADHLWERILRCYQSFVI